MTMTPAKTNVGSSSNRFKKTPNRRFNKVSKVVAGTTVYGVRLRSGYIVVDLPESPTMGGPYDIDLVSDDDTGASAAALEDSSGGSEAAKKTPGGGSAAVGMTAAAGAAVTAGGASAAAEVAADGGSAAADPTARGGSAAVGMTAAAGAAVTAVGASAATEVTAEAVSAAIGMKAASGAAESARGASAAPEMTSGGGSATASMTAGGGSAAVGVSVAPLYRLRWAAELSADRVAATYSRGAGKTLSSATAARFGGRACQTTLDIVPLVVPPLVRTPAAGVLPADAALATRRFDAPEKKLRAAVVASCAPAFQSTLDGHVVGQRRAKAIARRSKGGIFPDTRPGQAGHGPGC